MKPKRLRVLMIEDDAADAEIVKRTLRAVKTPIDLHLEVTLSEGLARLEIESFDLVLSDLSLPDSHGRETIGRIRRQDLDIPIIVLTGMDDDEFALELLDVGAQDYLIKSRMSSDSLERSIRHAIQRQQNFGQIRRLLSDLQEGKQLLERKNKSLAKLYTQAHEFVDNVSHEFRTPLTVIKEYVSLIREEIVSDPVEQKRLLSVVEDRADDLNIMVDDMLDVSKLEAGMLGAWRKNCSIGEIIEHVRASLERKAQVKRVKLNWNIDVGDVELYCDSEKAGRVITNLAINAIKFCGDPGAVTVAARHEPASGDIVFSISDNGPGIDDESLTTIFRRFKQLASNGQGSTKGFGLGLNIAKELVDLNFGQMNVTSQLGKGSTFSFTVPVADSVEVMRRYLQRLERLTSSDEDASVVSIVSTILDDFVDDKLTNDVDAFLNCCLRKNDLLFRIDQRRWLIALPEPESELEKYFDRIESELTAANRNRPFGPLPDVSLQSEGSWRALIHRDEILDCVRALLTAKEACYA